MAEKSKVHNGLILHWSTTAVREDLEIIGFYFDRSGVPQPINNRSLYGLQIRDWEAENKG